MEVLDGSSELNARGVEIIASGAEIGAAGLEGLEGITLVNNCNDGSLSSRQFGFQEVVVSLEAFMGSTKVEELKLHMPKLREARQR